MSRQVFISCEVLFPDIYSAWTAAVELGKFGISCKVFEGIFDPPFETIFCAAWRAGDNVLFQDTVTKIVEQHGGSADCFGCEDHVPIPSDFGFVETTS
ncbi:MAG TPA: hypothetical protein VI077_03160 [Pseudolabrys sp.]